MSQLVSFLSSISFIVRRPGADFCNNIVYNFVNTKIFASSESVQIGCHKYIDRVKDLRGESHNTQGTGQGSLDPAADRTGTVNPPVLCDPRPTGDGDENKYLPSSVRTM